MNTSNQHCANSSAAHTQYRQTDRHNTYK